MIKNSLGVQTITPLTVIGLSGFAWILIAPTVLSKKKITFHAMAIFILPVIASSVILDGTRVVVAISAAATFFSWKHILDLRTLCLDKIGVKQLHVYLGVGFLLLLLTPLLYMDIGGQLRRPYKKLIGILQQCLWVEQRTHNAKVKDGPRNAVRFLVEGAPSVEIEKVLIKSLGLIGRDLLESWVALAWQLR